MPVIKTDFTDPEGTSITVGDLKFIAAITSGSVLKGTSVSVTSGGDVTLGVGEYRVYYTPSLKSELYIGLVQITSETTVDTQLTTLLADQ